MNDIADTLGVSRQTVYRIFDSRSLLLEYIATGRLKVLSDKLTKFLKNFTDVREALVEGMIYSVKLGREDQLLHEIVQQEGDAHFKTFLFGGTPEVQEMMLKAYRPFMQAARERGELASEITDLEAVEWMCNIGAVLNLREEYDEVEHRRILRKFMVPSLIRPQAA
jgi:AcrR family transcriptional regulator